MNKATHNTTVSLIDLVNFVIAGNHIDRMSYSLVYQVLLENYGECFSTDWSMGMTTKVLSRNHSAPIETPIQEDVFVMNDKFRADLELLLEALNNKLFSLTLARSR